MNNFSRLLNLTKISHYLKCIGHCYRLLEKESSQRRIFCINLSRTYFAVCKRRYKTFIFYYFWGLCVCCEESYHEAIKESVYIVNMFFSTSVAFDGRFLESWCTLIKKCFSLLWNCMHGVSLSIAICICICIYMCAYFPRAHTLPAINNANGFRQQCQGIMYKHGCVNKIQKNCSISRLRIAYLPEPLPFLIIYI